MNHPRHDYLPGTPVTWVAAAANTPEAILAGVRAGRTAITRLPTPDAPALVRNEDELVAVAADGTVLRDLEGRQRILHGDRVVLAAAAAGAGPFRLETPEGEVLAVSA